MLAEPLVKELLEAGVHFGHQTHRWNPKMKRFIFGEKNGIYVVDLAQTAQGLEAAQEFLRSVAAEGGPILFVGTKRQAQVIIQEEAIRCEQFYVNFRWLGGLLTNFQTVRKSIERLKTIRSWREGGALSRMTKKEAARAEKELAKLEKVLSGILGINRLPKAIFVVDAKREETAVKEANRLGIPVVALVDTNSDPDPIRYVIPGNDDAIRSIKLVTCRLADAILEGRQSYLAGLAESQPKVAAPEEEPKEPLEPQPEPSQAETPIETPEAVPPAAEPLAAVVPVPPVIVEEDVEQIVPEGALKAKIKEAEIEPRKKKITKPKGSPKSEVPGPGGKVPGNA